MASSLERDKDQDRSSAVGIYLSKENDGRVEVRLDDLQLLQADPPHWRHQAYFTSLFFDERRLLSHQLTEKEYAAIGKAVAARLAALRALTD